MSDDAPEGPQDFPPGTRDSVAQRLGQSLTVDGSVPDRLDDLPTASYRSLSDHALWNEITRVQPRTIVGIKPPDIARGVFRGQSMANRDDLARFADEITRVEGVRPVDDPLSEYEAAATLDDQPYPAIIVDLADARALSELRRLTVVDYIEPLYFLDGIGCALPTYSPNVADEMFSPNPAQQQPDNVSWNYRHMGIQDAWALFKNGPGVIVAPGKGIKLGIIDTGLYSDAPQFETSTFPLPQGTRNPVERLSAMADAAVHCSHGTRIAGLAAAPAAGTASPANYVGIAWGSDTVCVKVGNGVVQAGTSVYTVVAGMDMAIAAGARVLTLAFGMPYVSDYLRDNIVRIYDDQSRPSVLMVAAAGTNVPWVTFPASMTRETVAVTIVDFRPTSVSRYKKYAGLSYFPDIVAYGSAVDFAAVNGPGDIPTQGNAATLLTTIGGSSSATAMIAGIAAVAWSKIPHLSRAGLVSRLVESSSLAGIEGETGGAGRSLEVGWGIPDAYVAAGGARRAAIEGPQSVTPGAGYQLTASVNGYEPFFTYQWDTGETAQTIAAVAGAPGTSRSHSVVITNTQDSSVLTASLTVQFTGAHVRTIYAEQIISEWATFLVGKRVDRLVNSGRQLRDGCSVVSVRGLEYARKDGVFVPVGVAAESKDNGHNGFTVRRPGGIGPRSLDAIAHVWHDGLSAVRMRVAYEVWEVDPVDCVEPGITRAVP
ncbi:S8 family serine peptidase [Streptomyces phaeochromogenes]|uniref:S8 family peptidase n=1 Tax=Streptomyces phaeochromogenes TaxID=1923 RepID=UPI0036C7F6E5